MAVSAQLSTPTESVSVGERIPLYLTITNTATDAVYFMSATPHVTQHPFPDPGASHAIGVVTPGYIPIQVPASGSTTIAFEAIGHTTGVYTFGVLLRDNRQVPTESSTITYLSFPAPYGDG